MNIDELAHASLEHGHIANHAIRGHEVDMEKFRIHFGLHHKLETEIAGRKKTYELPEV